MGFIKYKAKVIYLACVCYILKLSQHFLLAHYLSENNQYKFAILGTEIRVSKEDLR